MEALDFVLARERRQHDVHDVLVKYLHVPEGDAGGWVTFRPSLVRALLHMANPDGPLHVLELGTGPGSSPMLAELAATGTMIVDAVESDAKYFDVASSLRSPSYRPCVGSLTDVRPMFPRLSVSGIPPFDFDVVLVDHAPVAARARDLAELARMSVGLVVVHDWNCDVYGYDKSLFRWCVEDRGRWPNTAVLSNVVDLSTWLGYEAPPGMATYRETIDAWEAAARGAHRSSHIHPTGSDPPSYEASGARAAADVALIAAEHTARCTDVLDYGCGDGRVLRHLPAVFPTVYGYDTSPAMRAAARVVCGSKVTLIQDAEVMALESPFCDLAFSFAVFIHHTQANGRRMLLELARTVRLGGIVAVDIPLYDVAREPSSWTDVGVWTLEQLLDAADTAGLFPVETLTNAGAFSYDAVGPNHGRLQVFRRTK
jgi:SAM-dependent methyltransferase